MDISFPSKWFGRRMDIRTTAPYLESCLSNLLAEGDLAIWASHEGHLQLRDSVGISPTSLPRGDYDLISREGALSENIKPQLKKLVGSLVVTQTTANWLGAGVDVAVSMASHCDALLTQPSWALHVPRLSQRSPVSSDATL